jgi:hypothetical protein
MFWTAGSIYKKYRGSLEKLTTERVSTNLDRWISIECSRLDRGKSRAALRPEQKPEGESRGGAIAGDGYLTIQSTNSRNKNTI